MKGGYHLKFQTNTLMLSASKLLKKDYNCAFYILPCAPTAEFLNSQEEPHRDAVLFDLALFTNLGR